MVPNEVVVPKSPSGQEWGEMGSLGVGLGVFSGAGSDTSFAPASGHTGKKTAKAVSVLFIAMSELHSIPVSVAISNSKLHIHSPSVPLRILLM